MIIPNIWENKKCSKPPTSFKNTGSNRMLFPWNPTLDTCDTWIPNFGAVRAETAELAQVELRY